MSTMQRDTLSIDGMHCDHCVDAVNEALSGVDGVTVETVEVGEATVTYDSTRASRDRLAQALDEAGYALAG